MLIIQRVVVLLVLMLLLPAESFPDASESRAFARKLGLSAEAIERVAEGEVVAEDLEAASDKDLSLAVVMVVAAPPEVVFELVESDKFSKLSTSILSEGVIDPTNPSLAALQLPDDLLDALVEDSAGTFHMSEAEAEQVAAAARKGRGPAMDAYRAALEARVRSYWTKGLSGITAYAGRGRSPVDDLRHANEAVRGLLTTADFRSELEAIPSESSGKPTHRFSWALEKTRAQAAPVLIHHIDYRGDDRAIFLQRRFYSGYDYDALQIVVGVVQTRPNESVVFYTNHTFTSQVAGFGGGVKRSIGRELLETELVAELTRIRKAIDGAR